MYGTIKVGVIIPALNEEAAIGHVLRALPSCVDEVVVVDNGSTDRTADVARSLGARVVSEARRGYGQACLTGTQALGLVDVVVFMDADASDYPEELVNLVQPIADGVADLVIGSRIRGVCERGALTPQQRFGNWLACHLIKELFGHHFSDLGPFRALRRTALEQMHMDDLNYGWTVQMQVRAVKHNLRVVEVPVSYRRRIGRSKISGTIRGVLSAGSKILYTIFKEWLRPVSEARQEWLLVFARYPQPGLTKTRLIDALGAEGAATLQHRMTLGLLQQTRRLRDRRGTRIVVHYAGGDLPLMQSQYGKDVSYRPQCEGELGKRLGAAFAEAFSRGAPAVIAVGTDCPALTESILGRALDALNGDDVVVGPATDGGYYLIGLRRLQASLFHAIDWGTSRVLEQTLHAAHEAGLSVRLLDPLNDVDRPEDVVHGRQHLDSAAPRISIIIPALNEQEHIGRAIRSAITADDAEAEIIVVDGNSSDETVTVARSCGATVVHGGRGRARQMNAGAAAARGEVLLFLHADSQLPVHYVRHVRHILAWPGTVAGAFSLEIQPTGLGMRVHAATTNFRSRGLGIPYGDQAIFLTRATFDAFGGYPDTAIMEDLEFVLRLQGFDRIRIANALVRTSGRRWQRHGVWKMSLLNQLVIVAYMFGAPAELVRRWRESGIILPRRALLCGMYHPAGCNRQGNELRRRTGYEAVGPQESAF